MTEPSTETLMRNVLTDLRDAFKNADAPMWVTVLTGEICARHIAKAKEFDARS